jgi:syntaxin of plants SYP7
MHGDSVRQKSARAAKEKKNRAVSVTLDADVRRTKARLLEEVVELQKVAARKVNGLSPEEKVSRTGLVAALPHRIHAIPDSHGGGGATDQDAGWNARPGMKLDDYSGHNSSCELGHLTIANRQLNSSCELGHLAV